MTRRRLEDFTQHEERFRAHTREWILAQDKRFREIEATEVAKRSKPLRHPKGQAHGRHSREYLWSDALFCQDRHSEPFELYFYPDGDPYDDEFFSEMVESQGCDTPAGKVWDWLTKVFEEEFERALPDMAHVLEA